MLAIVVAMPGEMAHVETLLGDHDARRDGTAMYGPRRYDRVTLGALPIVLTTSGIGMVAAAATTEAVIARYAPRAVLNYGCTGAHRDDILLGDVVVGTACVAYDSGRLRPGAVFEHTAAHLYRNGAETRVDAFPANPALLAVAEAVAGSYTWRPEPWPQQHWPVGVPYRAPRVFFGPVGSADRFTQDVDALRALHAHHATLCEDMEAAAIAHVCALHDVPFLTVKDISNNEFHTVSTFGEDGTFALLAPEIGKRAAAFLFALVARLAALPDFVA